MERLKSTQRTLLVRPAARRVRRITKRVKRTETPAERKARKEKRAQHEAELSSELQDIHALIWQKAHELQQQHQNHSIDYYHRLIMQSNTARAKPRKLSQWSAFVSKEVRRRNDEAEQEEGGKRLKSSNLSKELSERWAAMSAEERTAATADYIEEYERQRELATVGKHNVNLRAFHDTKRNCEQIQANCTALHARTGIQIFFIAVRSELENFNKPFFFATSSRIEDFFNTVLNTNIADMSLRMEAYMISGVEGVTKSYAQNLVRFKSEIARLIHAKLNEAAGYIVPKMTYVNFASRMTLTHRIIVEGWPLSKFCNPSEIGSRADLELLYQSLQNNTTRFKRLDDGEYEEFCLTYQQTLPSDGADSGDMMQADTTSPDATRDNEAAPNESSVPATQTDDFLPTSAPPSANPASALTPSTQPNHPAPDMAGPPSKRRKTTDGFVSCLIGGADGMMVESVTKARKPRKDKGVPRGSRGGKGKENARPT
ncbi:hypothetical protein CVT24_013218 [Panaeolus cyanescens]|uniref:Uncharacterized protein n=1 Tax=Panaeolus cyanescens TaxID=181874 RepID=A0A409YMU1_9AGAR|nr:hypothetical protein CVT24_013218 [Panaeolus cyanescens]